MGICAQPCRQIPLAHQQMKNIPTIAGWLRIAPPRLLHKLLHQSCDLAEQHLLGCLHLPILHPSGVMLVRRRRQRQPNIEIRQISDDGQTNQPGAAPTPKCNSGALAPGSSHRGKPEGGFLTRSSETRYKHLYPIRFHQSHNSTALELRSRRQFVQPKRHTAAPRHSARLANQSIR